MRSVYSPYNLILPTLFSELGSSLNTLSESATLVCSSKSEPSFSVHPLPQATQAERGGSSGGGVEGDEGISLHLNYTNRIMGVSL